MVVAITGASGFVGRVVVPLLVGQGRRVRALMRAGGALRSGGAWQAGGALLSGEVAGSAGSVGSAGVGQSGGAAPSETARMAGVEIVTGDLLRRESLAELVRGADVVIHLAAAITVGDTFDAAAYHVNMEGTRLLLEAARAAGVCRFIQVSSVVVFEQAPYDQLLNEDRSLALGSVYDYERSKLTAHTMALSFNAPDFEVVVLAPTAVVGPYDWRPSRIGEMVMNLYRRRIPAIFAGGIDFVDVRDVAAALVASVDRGTPGQVYLLSGGWHSLAELRDAVAAVAAVAVAAGKGGRVGRSVLPLVLPLWLVRGAVPLVKVFSAVTGRFRYFNYAAINKVVDSNRRVDPSKARAELGFTSRPFAETIGDTVAWFRQEGYLT